MQSDKMTHIIYADLESLTRKLDGCANNLERSSTMKIGDYIPYEYSMFSIGAFDTIDKKHYFISWGRLYEKVFYFPRRTCNKYSLVWKK